MEVDPATARRWLENNFRNRPVKEDVVQAYARDMANGVWVATHQGIAFNDRDELIDGQHRLLAVGRAGVTVRMMVTFGLPSVIDGREMTTMDAVDRGRTRSVADQLKIQHGLGNSGVIAAVSQGLAALCCNKRTRRLGVGETLEIYRTFQAAVDWVIARRPKADGLRSAGVLVGFAFALRAERQPDGSPVARLFESLLTGSGLAAGSPVAMLREFLTSDAARLLTRGTDRGLAELVLLALWLQTTGQAVERLELSPAGADYYRARLPEAVGKIAALFALPERGAA